MNEIRLYDKISLNFGENSISGYIVRIEYDRIYIKIAPQDVEIAKILQELDEVSLTAITHLGCKKSTACVIETINDNDRLVVENNSTIETEQKRNFTRIVCDFEFKIIKNNETYMVSALNISAGGVAFNTKEKYFNLNDEVIIVLPEEIFGKEIKCNGKIVKMNDLKYALTYDNLSEDNQNRIMKYIFNLFSKNKNLK